MAPKRFLVTGGQMHGNLGAAAMSIVTIEQIRKLYPEAEISFTSKYAAGERRNVERFFGDASAVQLVPAKQLRATFVDLPLSLLTSPIACSQA